MPNSATPIIYACLNALLVRIRKSPFAPIQLLLCVLISFSFNLDARSITTFDQSDNILVVSLYSNGVEPNIQLELNGQEPKALFSLQQYLQQDFFVLEGVDSIAEARFTSDSADTVYAAEQINDLSDVEINVLRTLNSIFNDISDYSIQLQAINELLTNNKLSPKISQYITLQKSYLTLDNLDFKLALQTSERYFFNLERKLAFQCYFLTQANNNATAPLAVVTGIIADIGKTIIEIDRHQGQLSVSRQAKQLDKSSYLAACQLPLDKAASVSIYGDSLIQDAQKILDASLVMANKIGDTNLTAKVMDSLWIINNRLGLQSEAEIISRQTLSLLKEKPSLVEQYAVMSSQAATSLMELGRYSEAIKVLASAYLEQDDIHFKTKENILFSSGFLFRKLGEYDTAIQYFGRILESYQISTASQRELATLPCAEKYLKDESPAAVLTQLGTIKRMQGSYIEAIALLKCALSLYPNDHFYYKLVSEIELAHNLVRVARYSEAMEAMPTKERIAAAQMPQKLDAELINVALHSAMGEDDQLSQALERISQLLGHNQFLKICADESTCMDAQSSVEYPIKQIQLFKLLIDITPRDQNSELIEFYFQRATRVLKHIRKAAIVPQAWNQAQYSLVEAYVDAKFESTRDNLYSINSTLFEVLEQFYSLQLDEERRLYSHSRDIKTETQLNQAFEAWMKAEQALLVAPQEQRSMRNTDVINARNRFFQFQPVKKMDSQISAQGRFSLAEIQHLMNAEDIFIRYFVGAKRKFALIVTKNDINRLDLDSTQSLSWQDNHYNEINWQEFASFSQENHILPVQKLLSGQYKKLVIVPDQSLHKLPFSALKLQGENGNSFYLGSKLQLVLTQSAYQYFAPKPASASKPTVALYAASGKFDETNMSKANIASDSIIHWIQNIEPLPGVLKEAKTIENFFEKHTILKGIESQATRDFLMSADVRQSDILHIATHGLFDPQSPDSVGLMTYSDENKGMVSLITLNELLSESFSSEMIVVSGCNTMMGRNYKGSGMRSLTRGFLAQGANSVLGTIWPIPDAATAYFMRSFYKNLVSSSHNSAEALRLARIELMNNPRYRHPRYWAGFVLNSRNHAAENFVFN